MTCPRAFGEGTALATATAARLIRHQPPLRYEKSGSRSSG